MITEFKITQQLIDDFVQAVEQHNDRFILNALDGTHAADISALLENMDGEDCHYIINLLDRQLAAEIISYLEEDTQREFLKLFTTAELASLMDFTDSDDAVDILSEQPVRVREETIAQMKNRTKANHIVDLLRYEDDCAGGLMAKELIRANINWNVKQCIDEIRRQGQHVEKILTIYVVDDQDVLIGKVSLKKLILATDEKKVIDLYDPEIQSVQTYFHEEEVAEVMEKYDLEAVPVVNVQGKLMGRITIDDIVDVIRERAELNQQIMSGISEDIEESDSVWLLSRARLPWLVIGMMGGLLGANLIELFEGDLATVPALAFFIPLITATGGNVGIQSSTIVVQALANADLLGSRFERFIKSLLVAIINGVVIALIVFSFNYFTSDINLAIVVSIALFSVVLLASFMGTITPLVLDRLGINPALASGPFITTANDLLGLIVYFSVAKLLLGY